jgi:hypothetical protein
MRRFRSRALIHPGSATPVSGHANRRTGHFSEHRIPQEQNPRRYRENLKDRTGESGFLADGLGTRGPAISLRAVVFPKEWGDDAQRLNFNLHPQNFLFLGSNHFLDILH